MAEKRTIELEVKENFKQVEKDLESLNQALDDTANSTKGVNATFEEVYGDLQPLTTRLGEAEDRLYELAAAGDTTSKEYQNLLSKVSEYRKVQINTDLAVDAASSTMSQKLGGALGGVASGFELAQGTMALFGTESEAVQETLLKVQSAMAISQGIQGIREASNSFKQLGVVAGNALKGIRTGIAATGIGVFVIAIGTLVAYWDDIKAAVSGVSKEQDKLNKLTDANLKSAEAKLDSLNKQDNILRLQGKTEKQILQLKVAALETTIKQAEINLANAKATKKAQLEAEKRNYVILRGILEFISFPLAALLRTIDEVAKFWGKDFGLSDMIFGNLTELVFNPSEVAEEGDAAIKAAEDKLAELRNTQAGYKIEINRIEKEAQDERNKINSQGNRETTNNNDKAAKDQIDIQRRLEDEKLRIQKESRKKELDELDLRYKRLEEDAEKELANDKDKEVKLKKLKEQYAESKRFDVSQINAKWDKIDYDNFVKAEEERFKKQDEQYNILQKAQNSARDQELFELMQSYDAKFELAKNNAELEKALTEQFNKEQAAIIERYRKEEEAKKKEADEKERARLEQLNKDRFQLAKDGLQLVSDLASLFGQQDEKKAKLAFQVDKAAKISSATIAGYEAVLEAYKTGQKSPLTAVFPAYPYIQAGLAGAFAAVNIAKIGKAKFQSSGGGGGSMAPSGGGGGGAAPMTANFNTIGASGINQLAQLQQQPTQAYVVSGEVTSAQALDRNRVQNATL